MRMEEYISFLSEKSKDEEEFLRLRAGTPLGMDAYGEAVLSQKTEHPYTVRNTCVTGLRRTGFIRKLIITLSCLYEKSEANFLVVSPRTEYGELMRGAFDKGEAFVYTPALLALVMMCGYLAVTNL